jgi:catalase
MFFELKYFLHIYTFKKRSYKRKNKFNMSTNKPRLIKDFNKLSKDIQEQIKYLYPEGFSQHLIRFTNKDGLLVSALPFETEEAYYLVKMTVEEAKTIIEDDEDYDSEGLLKEESRDEYASKYAEVDYLAEKTDDDDDDTGFDQPDDDDDD